MGCVFDVGLDSWCVAGESGWESGSTWMRLRESVIESEKDSDRRGEVEGMTNVACWFQ